MPLPNNLELIIGWNWTYITQISRIHVQSKHSALQKLNSHPVSRESPNIEGLHRACSRQHSWIFVTKRNLSGHVIRCPSMLVQITERGSCNRRLLSGACSSSSSCVAFSIIGNPQDRARGLTQWGRRSSRPCFTETGGSADNTAKSMPNRNVFAQMRESLLI